MNQSMKNPLHVLHTDYGTDPVRARALLCQRISSQVSDDDIARLTHWMAANVTPSEPVAP